MLTSSSSGSMLPERICRWRGSLRSKRKEVRLGKAPARTAIDSTRFPLFDNIAFTRLSAPPCPLRSSTTLDVSAGASGSLKQSEKRRLSVAGKHVSAASRFSRVANFFLRLKQDRSIGHPLTSTFIASHTTLRRAASLTDSSGLRCSRHTLGGSALKKLRRGPLSSSWPGAGGHGRFPPAEAPAEACASSRVECVDLQ
jgi:hypothetical protein